MSPAQGTLSRLGNRRALFLALAALLAVVFVAVGIARFRGGGAEAEWRQVGNLRVAVETVPAAPKVGENRLRVRVRNASGDPARGLQVTALVFMPQMGAMPYMESRPQMEEKGSGRHEGSFNLVMGGSWDMDLTLRAPGAEPARAALRLTVGSRGVTWVTEEGAGADSGGAAAAGTVALSAARRQELGVTTDTVRVRDLDHDRRTTGRVTYDETRRAEVSLKFQAWIEDLRADFTGQPVRKGDVLFTVYSPELYSAQREFLEARSVAENLPPGPVRERASELADAARRRLLLWDLTPAQVRRLERTRQPIRNVPIVSPVSGVVVEKMVVQGSSVMPGQVLFRIAPLHPVWVIADVFQYELPLLQVGAPVSVRLPGAGGAALRGRIQFIYPSIQESTRTGQVRAEVPNPSLALKPEMFVDVTIHVPLGRRLAVPASAVIYSGERRVVFVDRGGGRLEPREVRLATGSGEWFPVESGLAEGEVVVTSGNFLVAAESRLRSALRGF